MDLNTHLTKIAIFWDNITKENSDDIEAYDYIATQSMSLKMIVLQATNIIEEEITKSKENKIKYQKLQKTLKKIFERLDFKIKIEKDKNYIEEILNKLSEIKNDIEVIKIYQQ